MPLYSGIQVIRGDEHKKYRIPASDIEKVKIISPFGIFRLEGIKDAGGNWIEFNIPFGQWNVWFEYL